MQPWSGLGVFPSSLESPALIQRFHVVCAELRVCGLWRHRLTRISGPSGAHREALLGCRRAASAWGVGAEALTRGS